MEKIPFRLEKFEAQWIRERVSSKLAQAGQSAGDLEAFVFGADFDEHFVLGSDKQGVLWRVADAYVDSPPAQVFAEVTYLQPAKQLGDVVHGGAVTSIIDACAAGCGVLALRYPAAFATAEQTVHFKRPLRVGETYLLWGRHDLKAVAGSEGRHRALVRCDFLDETGTARAVSESLIKVPRSAWGQ
jgi:acyl-coenzyme A thioesterase PaaI-like protein